MEEDDIDSDDANADANADEPRHDDHPAAHFRSMFKKLEETSKDAEQIPHNVKEILRQYLDNVKDGEENLVRKPIISRDWRFRFFKDDELATFKTTAHPLYEVTPLSCSLTQLGVHHLRNYTNNFLKVLADPAGADGRGFFTVPDLNHPVCRSYHEV